MLLNLRQWIGNKLPIKKHVGCN